MTTPGYGAAPSMGYLVWRLAVKWRSELDRALAQLGLTSAQYGVLASLHGLSHSGAQPSQRQLAEVAGLEPMFVSNLVRALERSGLLERRSNSADSRARRLTITARGVEVVTAARATVVELEARRLAPLGGTDSKHTAQLRDALQSLLRQADSADPADTKAPGST